MNAQNKQVKLGENIDNKKKEITYEDFVENIAISVGRENVKA